MREVVLVCEMIKFGTVVYICTVSCCCHSTPNYVSCMSICLNVPKFHARHNIIWKMYIMSHKNMGELSMRIELFLSRKGLLLFQEVSCVWIQDEIIRML
jgi:hypothetical protein